MTSCVYDTDMAAFSHASLLNENLSGRWLDDSCWFSVSLFPPELSEEEAEDVLLKEVNWFLFEDSEISHYSW